MDTLAKGLSILRRAEVALREVAREAAGAGDYQAIMTLAAWGQELARLSTSAGSTPQRGSSVSSTAVPLGGPSASPSRAEPAGRVRRRHTRDPRPKGRGPGEGYPRFFRKGDLLVKVGWSKREKAQYQHKAPRDVLGAVVEALQRSSGDQDLIAIPALLPLKGPGGEEIPPYQVYVCLAWLRTLGLIEQHGREGYSVGSPGALSGDVSAAWEGLERLRAAEDRSGS